jgi:4-amino-4-deoxy-L-arabinose transferase-like glycosyltransferase
LALAALLAASRLCHSGVLWEGDALPLAAAGQMLDGKVLYRDIWYDKPPLVPLFQILGGARPGWGLRLAGALYMLACCGVIYGFARSLWSRREALRAAALFGFFSTFYIPSSVIPAASDLLLIAPHVAAVWMAYKRRAFWSGALAGVAFWVSPKAVFGLAACALWFPGGASLIAAGFAAAVGTGAAALWAFGALPAYWSQVWVWGRLYAAVTFIQTPLWNGAIRTANWMGFHAPAVISAAYFLWSGLRFRRSAPESGSPDDPRRWAGWLFLALMGVSAGLRFFPRYYFLLMPIVILMAARGLTLLGRRGSLVPLLLLIALARFGPGYITVLTNPNWRDVAMDRDSQAAAAMIRKVARPGDSLFVWGYRPELYAYTRLPAATRFLDTQPLTGVPADRHLTSSEPIETVEARERRLEAARSAPAFIADGLSLYNPQLSITRYPELREWFSHYREAARSGQTIIYRRVR